MATCEVLQLTRTHYVIAIESKFFPKYLLFHLNETAANAAKVHVLYLFIFIMLLVDPQVIM